MISMPPSERDLHAYVDHQLSDADRQRMDTYLASHPDLARQVRDWQRDAQHLRAALGATLRMPANPDLDPVAIRQRRRDRSRRHLASAAVLLIAVSLGGVSGWQARQLTLPTPLPMADAMQAYRMFATQDILPADFKVDGNGDLQGWLDRYFSRANRLPNLADAGFKPVSARLLSTEQGAAAMVLYQDPQGRRITYYMRPPGPQNHLLERGHRRDGELQAEYWSGPGYNYAMVAPADTPVAQVLRQATPF
ncbi:anti-sigma factor family protein [Pseudomonas sp. RHF3.3-3]|uniref:Putative transmembrane transcriptional regulator (Anti-sigma factor) n=3 Tax=Pseudomonas asplenii TaxID=53407 RepID=A0A0M9GE44_9PSED|nr:anti-sigma factor [Pseudomonas fuscovaginae]KPA88868.1 putative transmembrane transcriptional regulator (anti-sigma factor) [Pseudomonas fuscovaginae]